MINCTSAKKYTQALTTGTLKEPWSLWWVNLTWAYCLKRVKLEEEFRKAISDGGSKGRSERDGIIIWKKRHETHPIRSLRSMNFQLWRTRTWSMMWIIPLVAGRLGVTMVAFPMLMPLEQNCKSLLTTVGIKASGHTVKIPWDSKFGHPK